ncbi:hypothetical protein LTR78_001449 [Recurvomyces mirabilis]|uniref:Uncharacterized protein n=1 Tax=Recurvomyces mirabilis TaxID=574656 RepID=A0AAE0WWU5_9PEZI|nr:hypothetical protein LTR78_001449 [Recurvomyces mirabilis]KAK5161426.1 hypothetical protein LTS14_001222 [Recurvomyces mirabilis]
MASPFFCLSSELRNRVYILALQHECTISLDNIKQFNALVQTSRQTRTESSRIFFANNIFIMNRFTHVRLARFIAKYGSEVVCNIKAMRFRWDLLDQIVIGFQVGEAHATLDWHAIDEALLSFTDEAVHRVLQANGLQVQQAYDGEQRLWVISLVQEEEDDEDVTFSM